MAKKKRFAVTADGRVFKVIQDHDGNWYDKPWKFDVVFMDPAEYRWIYPELFASKKEAKKVAKCLRWAGGFVKQKLETIYPSVE